MVNLDLFIPPAKPLKVASCFVEGVVVPSSQVHDRLQILYLIERQRADEPLKLIVFPTFNEIAFRNVGNTVSLTWYKPELFPTLALPMILLSCNSHDLADCILFNEEEYSKATEAYLRIEPELSKTQREAVQRYIDTLQAADTDQTDNAYIAGIRDGIRFMVSFGLIEPVGKLPFNLDDMKAK